MTETARLFDVPEVPPGERVGRIQGWAKYTAPELWEAWRRGFESDDAAIMSAVWALNRLIKTAARSTRIKGYSLKDEAIRRYGEVGMRVREEKKLCWGCDGSGMDEYGDVCERCDGSGVYASRWLYLHIFTVAGQRYSLHSYQVPRTLLDETGEDKESFGGSFSTAEKKALALPMSGLLKMLGYVAVTQWGLVYTGARYVQPYRPGQDADEYLR